jgi:hypothetical protein
MNDVIKTLTAALNDTNTVLVKGQKTYKLQDANLPVEVGVTYFNGVLAKLKAAAASEKAKAAEKTDDKAGL